MLEPSPIIEFSHITPVPTYTLSFGELIIEQSLSRAAPSISAPSPTTVFVISLAPTIFTPSPMAPRSGVRLAVSSAVSCLIMSHTALSRECLTMNAASCELSLSDSTMLPSPASLSTATMLPCPKVAPSTVSMTPTSDRWHPSPMV